MKYETHIKLAHELYGACLQYNVNKLRNNHVTSLIVVTTPYACWFLWRVNYDVFIFNLGLRFEGLFWERYIWKGQITFVAGPKSTAAECQATYRQFFQMHVHHKDHVCFRAAVFANVLSNWCGQWNMTIDVNQYHKSHHEFLLLLKLQYRPTRWVRIVEAMAITHFIAGAHKCLINEFPNTRAGPLERFLRWQRMNAPELVARDEDLQKAIEKMEGRELKRVAADPLHQFGLAPKLLRR